MSWAIGDQVKVGTGKVVWRITGFAVFPSATPAEPKLPFANLERADRKDVHSTVEIWRLRRVTA